VVEAKEWVLTANDRCDARDCAAQAYIKATGVSGELLFCGHHYEDAVNTPIGYERMMNFAFEVVDERERLVENRTKGEN
jgi:hypothetical protein